MDSNQGHSYRPLTLKLAVIAIFTVIRIITVIVRSRFFGEETHLDSSWLMGLATYLQQGGISGRDFHFTYGPAAQVLAWISTALTATDSAFDAFRMMGIVFGTFTALVLGAVFLLYDRISWKHTALVYAAGLIMNLFSEIPSFRIVTLLLCAAFAYRTVAAVTFRRQIVWAIASGALCFLSQLMTPEIALMGAVVFLGTVSTNYILTRASWNASLAGVFLIVFATLNAATGVVFKLSSPSYAGIFDYQRYIVETMRGYNNTMGAEWGFDKTATTVMALLFVYTVVAAMIAARRSSRLDRCLITALILTATVSLKSAFVRSDVGHIAYAGGPLVIAFLMLARKEWQPRFGRAVWSVFAAGLFMVWPWVHWNSFDFYKGINGELPVLSVLDDISNGSIAAESILPPSLLDKEFRARGETPILPFPYQNYIPILLKRPLLAPVLQSYSGPTQALQRFYIDAVERQRLSGGLQVVYALDYVTGWPLDNVLSITRVPLLFEYLYRHFGLGPETEHADGHYVLEPRDTPRELVLKDLPFTDARTDDAAGTIRLQNESTCGLLRLDIRLTYPWKKFFFRPGGITISFRRGMDVVAVTPVLAAELDDAFTTYVSVVKPASFYKVFQSGVVPSPLWDNVVYEQTATDQLSARPRRIEITGMRCVNPDVFIENDAAWESLDRAMSSRSEVMGGHVQIGYARITPVSGPAPEIVARLGFAERTPSYADMPVTPAGTSYRVKLGSHRARDIGVGIANPHSSPIRIRIGSGDLALAGGHHVSRFLSELLPMTGAAIASGTVDFSSDRPFSLCVLSFSGRYIQALPIETISSGSAERGPFLFPQLALHGSWSTALILTNRSEAAVEGRIDIFSATGSPMPVDMNGVTSNSYPYSIPPGRVWILWPGAFSTNGRP